MPDNTLPPSPGVSVVKLACTGCGASLQIASTMERLACSHCGTQQVVQRTGGVVHLQGVTEAISKVQAGTDKTAAELAITRLNGEMQATLQQRENAWQLLANDRRTIDAKWVNMIESSRTKRVVISLIGGVVAGCVAVFFTVFVYQFLVYLLGSGAQAASFGFVAAVFAFVAGMVLTYIWTQRSERFNGKSLEEKRELELNMIDARTRREMARFDQHLNTLSMKIQKNREIANG